jgi:hypothetical protein
MTVEKTTSAVIHFDNAESRRPDRPGMPGLDRDIERSQKK